ncbi:SVAGG family GlyGly-CTERM protein [uncultured Shewanella sp.]|uniref:SVAGG family GlyGly-CTERM protein n=1 Tax=uncultured Shewanella sp. TaxID=173975 RepID=UPI002632B940|nr:SVAGG family GlyGly-CTERM protein [uncultured Shewanella sp.]
MQQNSLNTLTLFVLIINPFFRHIYRPFLYDSFHYYSSHAQGLTLCAYLTKTLKTILLLASLSISSFSQAKESIDLLVVVEPDVFAKNNPNRLTRESLQAALTQQINTANSLYQLANIHYHLVAILDWEDNAVSQRLSQGDHYPQALNSLMSAITNQELSTQFHSDNRAKTYLQQYYADKLIFITKEKDTSLEPFGHGFYQAGLSVHSQALMAMPSVLAHLLGHTLALEHPSASVCQSMTLLMCSPFEANIALSITDLSWLGQLTQGKNIPHKTGFDNSAYLGEFSPTMPKLANIKLSIDQRELSNEQRDTQITLQLVNDNGELKPLKQTISVELFTQSGTAVAAYHYPESLYQRVVFLSGETQKHISLEIQPSAHYANFNVGTRYGLLVNDSNIEKVTIIGDIKDSGPTAPTEPQAPTIEINPSPNPSAPVIDNGSGDDNNTGNTDDTLDSSGDSSGTTSLLPLLILLSIAFRRMAGTKNHLTH